MTGCEVLVHLAALTGVGQSMYETREYVDVNGVGTAVVLAAAGAAAVERVVLSSSRAVYGEGAYRCERGHVFTPTARRLADLADARWDHACPECGATSIALPVAESSPMMATSVYGASKVAQEQLVRAVCGTAGMDHSILRYFNVFGSGQAVGNPYTGIIGVFARSGAGKQASPIYEDGGMIRDFVHVSDVVAATCAAAEGRMPEVVVCNVGTGTPVTIGHLADVMARLQGAPAPIVSGQYRAGDIRHCYADTARLDAAGLTAKVSLEAGLTEYLDWFAEAGRAHHPRRRG